MGVDKSLEVVARERGVVVGRIARVVQLAGAPRVFVQDVIDIFKGLFVRRFEFKGAAIRRIQASALAA